MGQQVSHNKAITINKLAVSLFSLFLVPDGWINGWMDVWFWNHNLSAQSDTLYFSLGNAVTTIYRPDLLHLQCHFPLFYIYIFFCLFCFRFRTMKVKPQQNFLFHTPPAEKCPLFTLRQHFTQPWQEDNECEFTHREPRQTLSLHFLRCRMSIGAIYSQRIGGKWKMGPFVPFACKNVT